MKYRTAILGVVATVLLVWSVVYIFEIPWREMREMLVASLAGVVILILAALVASVLLRWLKR